MKCEEMFYWQNADNFLFSHVLQSPFAFSCSDPSWTQRCTQLKTKRRIIIFCKMNTMSVFLAIKPFPVVIYMNKITVITILLTDK